MIFNMNPRTCLSDILALTPEERILLVQQVWDTILDVPDAVELTDSQRRELRRRLDAHQQNPESAVEWKNLLASVGLRE